MTKNEMQTALRDIGLALNACHNTVTTDIPGVRPDKTSWRIDHRKEIAQLNALEEALLNNDIYP
jgi:hypothetical protein